MGSQTDSLTAMVSDLASRIDEIQRDVRVVRNTPAVRGETNTTAITGETYTELSAKVDVLTGTGGASWTTYDAAASIPIGTKRVSLEVEMNNTASPTGSKYIKVRTDSSSIEKHVARTEGTTVGDITASANDAFVVPTSSRTFDYYADNCNNHIIRITGYWT